MAEYLAGKTTDPWGVWEWARTDPSRVALEEPTGEVSTFGALAARTNQLARGLRDLGVRPGDAIAAVLKNSKVFYEIVLAASQIGVLIAVINDHLTPSEIGYILRDSGAKAIVAHSEFAARLTNSGEPLPAARFAIGEVPAGWQSFTEWAAHEDSADVADRSYGAVMGYTSGTTGRPKGVRRALGAVTPEEGLGLGRAQLAFMGLAGTEGRHLLCSPVHHAAPSTFSLCALNLGQTIVIHHRFTAEGVLDAISHDGITSAHLVPTHFHRMLRLPEEIRARADVSGLHTIIHAGAPCPPAIKQAMLEWFGDIIWEYLGATEGIMSIASPHMCAEHPGTVGKPIFPNGVIITKDNGDVADAGEAGTIYFLPTAAFEYHNAPEKTAESRAGDYATVGDVGYMDAEGFVYLLDRRTDLIISGGVNVYPAEVEAAVLAHPAVLDVGVIGVADPEWGRRVVAVVQPVDAAADHDVLRAQLETHVNATLPSFKRPRHFEFLAEFPRTETGKVRRRVLRELFDAAAG